MLEEEYFRSNYEIRSMLRALFNSDFFKSEKVRFARVKSPAEVVVGTLHLIGDFKFPKHGIFDTALECRYMNQDLLNPPSVEGWHTGKEWIDSGSMVERINFVADEVGNIEQPGVRAIVDQLLNRGPALEPEAIVEGCLELMGQLRLEPANWQQLIDQIQRSGTVRTSTPDERRAAERVTLRTLKMIGSTREYQFG
jgi:hypothetical protein